MASCNSTDILATAYRNGYAKLSSRDLMVAAIASACSTCNAQPLIETAIGLGYLKLSEFDAAMCIAESLCSSPGVTAAPAPTILKLAMQDHLAAMSRRDLDGVVAALLCKMTNPPCVTPATPGTPAAFSTLNNILKISWTQPPNSGSLILNYTVSYGTTQGGPYTSTVTVPAMTKQAILNGLTSGTTYYFVVTANSFTGCSSANSAEGSAATTGTPPISPVVSDWANRVVTNGGAKPSNATITAVDVFYKGLQSDGIDTLMIALNMFAPDNITAALTPLIVGPGLDPWTNIGGMNAGSISTSGLAVNGSTQCMDSGVSPATAFTSANDFGISGYTGNGTGLYSMEIGSFDNVNIAEIDIQGVGSAILAGAWAAWNINVAGLLSGSVFGFTSVSRITTMAAYQASNAIGFNTVTSGVAGSQVRPTPTLAVAGRNTNGAFTATVRSAWYSFAAIHHGLTAAQTQALFNRVQTLRTTFGGGFG